MADPKSHLPKGEDQSNYAGPPRRLGVALGASVLLAIMIGVVVLSGSNDAAKTESPCVAAWNGDRFATGTDGTHAYDENYRTALVTRMTPAGKLLPPGSEEVERDDAKRCVVVFATPGEVRDRFAGVRVFEDGRWSSLFFFDKNINLEEIEKIQQDAVGMENATLLSTGLLSED